VESIQKKLEQNLDEKWRAEASKYSNESFEGFMRVAKKSNTVLIGMIFHDINPAFQQLFTPQWYEQPQSIGAIIQTLDDYLQDFKKHLLDYLFSKLTTDVLEKFLLCYLEAIKHKQTKFKMPQALQLIRSDLNGAMTFWAEYKTQKRVKTSFDLIEKIVGILESSETMIFLSWYNLWKCYNDVPMTFIEDLLHKRDDLEKSVIKETVVNCKNKSKEANTEAVPSLFSKLSIPQ
jgi:exocyst complex component 3